MEQCRVLQCFFMLTSAAEMRTMAEAASAKVRANAAATKVRPDTAAAIAEMRSDAGVTAQHFLDLERIDLVAGDLDDELLVALIVERDHDGILRVVNVPKGPLSVLVKRPRRNDARQLRPRQPKPVPPALSDLRLMAHPRNMLERDLQMTL